MTLTIQNQITLLYDLLNEHSEEQESNVSEYQQIKRLVSSILANQEMTDEQLVQLLPEIYNYGHQGEHTLDVSEHVSTNKLNIENWVDALDNSRLE